MSHNLFNSRQTFDLGNGRTGQLYSLTALEKAGLGPISRLPVSIRIVLESVLRNCDGVRVQEQSVRELAAWQPMEQRTKEIPFVVARIVLQDFTGVPLLVDLAAMRSAVARMGKNPKVVEPLVPVDLVVDHSVQVDFAGTPEAYQRNLDIEFARNRERYEFLKWGMQAFDTFKVVPPGIGIVHQVNMEYLAKGVLEKDGVYYPDTLVGTDSHTTMINGLGVVAWGVGGIEAEAGMLGQPVYFLTPDVVGVHMTGELQPGVTATDLALHITQLLRKAKVVGKFVEFYGPGAAKLPATDRGTVANMAPEYGATMGFFPIDGETVKYLRDTGRPDEHCRVFESYYKTQGLFGMPQKGQIDYSVSLELDLACVTPSVAGPKRPQDRIELSKLKEEFTKAFSKPITENGFGKTSEDLNRRFQVECQPSGTTPGGGSQEPVSRRASEARNTNPLTELEMANNRPTPDTVRTVPEVCSGDVQHGSVLIAAITSCTNTSNPSVMVAAGLLAKKAVEKGLRPNPLVKASLAPGSRVVTDYLNKTQLQPYLDQLGFNLVGYGCTTCIGNSGPLAAPVEETVVKNDVIAASVLSGNRNFEARVHQSIRANFLMSPPLVVAFALAGRINIDMNNEPIGQGTNGPVYLKDVWPTMDEVRAALQSAVTPDVFRRLYRDFVSQNPKWNEIPSSTGNVYQWNEKSTYIQEPPFFVNFGLNAGQITALRGARALAIFGDSVTTDHISPAGSIKKTSPAGQYLIENGVTFEDFNSYGSRRGNDRVMTRGTFANVRIKNLMVAGIEGGVTKHQPDGKQVSIYDAAMLYHRQGTPLVVIAGHEYGTGSSRDWAAKGTALLGVRAVVAQSFERIHRSNLVGMGVLPLQFEEGTNAQSLGLVGDEVFDIVGLDASLKPQQKLTLRITSATGTTKDVPVQCRIDTPIEIEYYQHGGILPYVLRQLVAKV